MAGAVMLTKRAHGLEDAVDAINRARAGIDRRTKSRAFAPDPALPFQFPSPKRQQPRETDAPEVGVERDVLDPGETV